METKLETLKQQLWQASESVLAKEYFIIDIQLKELKDKLKVSVIVDGDYGISVDTCAQINRALDNIIEVNDWIQGPYILEVSSPGAEKPLKMLRQLPKHIGRTLQIVTQNGQTLEGTFKDLTNEIITIEQTIGKGKKAQTLTHQIAWQDIATVKVLISFK